ncbi:DUF4280 domain-containing protein [Paenibacillus sp. 481]|uniref:DUF4280 domain-containing protein n=1 Tax=Paenibacillus sp. 481 TaxID=2835869 RepID=UPI001E2FB944|nr:DUF4280 domain-containing protein [Paenibacillus sp. 481]UHA74778.1 DUF4280 domain-containing protein [Paenibacillus sp. 481]
MSDVHQYVVRGASMKCDCGSHRRKINLPTSHGSYVNGQPMMNESDCKPVDNISHFGICTGAKNQSGAVIYLIAEETGATISGKPCLPAILSNWMKVKENAKVEQKAALTTQSELLCELGGLITFLSNGQDGK